MPSLPAFRRRQRPQEQRSLLDLRPAHGPFRAEDRGGRVAAALRRPSSWAFWLE